MLAIFDKIATKPPSVFFLRFANLNKPLCGA